MQIVRACFISAWAVQADLCLDLPGGDVTNGNELQIYDCMGGESQMFSFDAHGILLHSPSGKCIAAGLQEDFPFVIWDCVDGDSSQLWTFDSDAGRFYNGADNSWCAEVVSAGAGSPVHVRLCDGSKSQFWTWDSDNSLVYANTEVVHAVAVYSQMDGTCWDVPDAAAGDGQVIFLNTCAGTPSQGWVWQDGSVTTGLDLKMCVDLPGADDANGNWLALYQCTGAPQQQWALDDSVGRIYMQNSAKCVDVERASAHLMIWDCLDADSQSFAIATAGQDISI